MISKIVIGDLELKSANGYFIQAVRDIGYKTKYPVASVLNIHGSKLGNAYFEGKTIMIELEVGGSTPAEFIARRTALFEKLTLQEFGDDYIDFDFYLADGKILTARGTIKDVSADLSVGNLTHGALNFTFEMEEPFFKSKQSYSVEFNITKGGGAGVPMSIPLDFSVGSDGYVDVYNGGNVFVFPVITFTGDLTNPRLDNLTSGKYIALSMALAASTNTVEIDTFDRTVLDETGANKRDKVLGDFFVLNIGSNQLRLSSDNALEGGKVKIEYQYYYISI